MVAGGVRPEAFGALLLRHASRSGARWSLQRHEAVGDRWLEVGHFHVELLARIVRDALVASGHGARADFRIRKVTEPAGA